MDRTIENDLMQATGLAVSMIGVLLEGKGVLPAGEFSAQLALLAGITRETDRAQSDILKRWADVAAQVSRFRAAPPSA
jgi:hypothetical protein